VVICASRGDEIANEFATAAAFKRAEKNFIPVIHSLKA
jgi:hypothetical protein